IDLRAGQPQNAGGVRTTEIDGGAVEPPAEMSSSRSRVDRTASLEILVLGEDENLTTTAVDRGPRAVGELVEAETGGDGPSVGVEVERRRGIIDGQSRTGMTEKDTSAIGSHPIEAIDRADDQVGVAERKVRGGVGHVGGERPHVITVVCQ